jgi:CheY-like chemotaxis protein
LKISNDIRIFIVEDDQTQAEVLNDKLLEYNAEYNIVKFKSGSELLDYFSNGYLKNKYNYLILDYYLQSPDEEGGLNGLAVIKKLAELNSNVKIILFSAYENDEDANFKDLIKEPNVIEFVKKSPHAFSSLQNIMRFDYAKYALDRKRSRFNITLIVFIFLLALSVLQFVFKIF